MCERDRATSCEGVSFLGEVLLCLMMSPLEGPEKIRKGCFFLLKIKDVGVANQTWGQGWVVAGKNILGFCLFKA